MLLRAIKALLTLTLGVTQNAVFTLSVVCRKTRKARFQKGQALFCMQSLWDSTLRAERSRNKTLGQIALRCRQKRDSV